MNDQQYHPVPAAPAHPHAPGSLNRNIANPPVRPPTISPIPAMRAATAVAPPQTLSEKDLAPLSLIEEVHPTGPAYTLPPPPKKIQAFGGSEISQRKHDWKRQPVKTGTGAIRVKSFHGKYSEQGLEYLDNAVNEWLDANPHVEVKFVTPTVMTFEGKIREPALVLNVWY